MVELEIEWYKEFGHAKISRAYDCYSSYLLQDDVAMLTETIELCQSAQPDAVNGPGLSAVHYLLGCAYKSRYYLNESLDDLTWALRTMRQATEEDPTQDRGRRLCVLANTLLIAVEMLEPGEKLGLNHIDLVDQWLTEAFPLLLPSETAMCRSSQGLARLERHRLFGDAEDWNTSFDLLVEARDLSRNDTVRAACLGNLGKALALRLQREPKANSQTALMMVAVFDEAAAISPMDDPDHALHLLHRRYAREQLGLDVPS